MQPMSSTSFKYEDTQDGKRILKRRLTKTESIVIQEHKLNVSRPPTPTVRLNEYNFKCIRCNFVWHEKDYSFTEQEKTNICFSCYRKELTKELRRAKNESII